MSHSPAFDSKQYATRGFGPHVQAYRFLPLSPPARIWGMDQLPVSWHFILPMKLLCVQIPNSCRSYDASIPCYYKTPEFFQKTGYKNPTDPADGVFQYTKGYRGGLFHYYTDNPREGASFNHIMGGVMGQQASWLDIISVENFLDGSDPSLPLVVDVGGNIGHDIEKFRQVYPDTAARLYLQDKAEVVELSKCPDPLNKMAHDFFQPQPIRGERNAAILAILKTLIPHSRCPSLLHARYSTRLARQASTQNPADAPGFPEAWLQQTSYS
jgi:hypothetical protein